MILTNRELNNIDGGAVSASYLNALVRGASFLYDLGRSFGTTMRQTVYKTHC